MFRFMDLPTELRVQIYQYAIRKEWVFHTVSRQAGRFRNVPQFPGILFVSRQVLSEAAPVFFGSNQFRIDLTVTPSSLQAAAEDINTKRKSNIELMRELEFSAHIDRAVRARPTHDRGIFMENILKALEGYMSIKAEFRGQSFESTIEIHPLGGGYESGKTQGECKGSDRCKVIGELLENLGKEAMRVLVQEALVS